MEDEDLSDRKPDSSTRFFSRDSRDKAHQEPPPQVSDQNSEIDGFIAQYVLPSFDEDSRDRYLRKQGNRETVTEMPPLPRDIWNRHILSRIPEADAPSFAEAFQTHPKIISDFYSDRFNFKQFISWFGTECLAQADPAGWRISHHTLFSCNLIRIRKLINEHKINLTEKNTEGETALLCLAKFLAIQNFDMSWILISDILTEFNPDYDNTLHLIPDHSGVTLESLISEHGRQHLFPNNANSQTMN